MKRRQFIRNMKLGGLAAATLWIIPELLPTRAHADSGRPWYYEDLQGMTTTKKVIDPDSGEITSYAVTGYLSSGELIERSGTRTGEASTVHIRKFADDKTTIIEEVEQQWRDTDEGQVLTWTSDESEAIASYRNSELSSLTAASPCPEGTYPRSGCVGVSKDFYLCCGISAFNGWLALIICPACLATYCTEWRTLCSTTP